MKQCLKQILSIVSLFFCTLFPISAKYLKFKEADCLEVILSDNLGKSNVKTEDIDVMLYDNSLHSKCLNPHQCFDLDGKKYILDINNIIISKSKFKYNNITFLEIHSSTTFQDENKNYTDVILYDIPVLNKVSDLNKKYYIMKNFTYNDKLYRIKAINKDIWDKYSSQCCSSILDNPYLIQKYFDNVNKNYTN